MFQPIVVFNYLLNETYKITLLFKIRLNSDVGYFGKKQVGVAY